MQSADSCNAGERKTRPVGRTRFASIYEALAGPKELTEMDWGHDWHPEMVGINRGWLARYLA